MHCPTMPEEKCYKESSGSSDGQSKAGSDFSKLTLKNTEKDL